MFLFLNNFYFFNLIGFNFFENFWEGRRDEDLRKKLYFESWGNFKKRII